MSVTNPSQVLEATEGFAAELDGHRYIVNRKSTRVAADHPLALNFPHLFRPVASNLSYDVEAATAEPGEVRNRPTNVGEAIAEQVTADAPAPTNIEPPVKTPVANRAPEKSGRPGGRQSN